MFSAQGLKDDDQHHWQRALLAMGNYLLPAGSNYSLLVDASTEPASWKRLLRTSPNDTSVEHKNRPLLKALWDRLEGIIPLPVQLDSIIANAAGLPAWRAALVRSPAAIAYCGRRAIRWSSEEEVMLLSKSTMGSAHAELFTYCLYQDLQVAANRERIVPLAVWFYVSTNDSYNPPHLQLNFQTPGHTTTFSVKHEYGAFTIQVATSSLEPVSGLKPLLTEQAGFEPTPEAGHWLTKRVPRADILGSLAQLAKHLSTYPTKPSSS